MELNSQFGHERISRLWFHAESTCVTATPFCGGELCSFSNPSPTKETPNEDSSGIFEIDEERGVIVVADGVGGARCGDLASQLIVESLADQLSSTAPIESLQTSILNSLKAANRAIIDLGKGAASTVAVVEFDQGCIRSYHAGDSKSYSAQIVGRSSIRLSRIHPRRLPSVRGP